MRDSIGPAITCVALLGTFLIFLSLSNTIRRSEAAQVGSAQSITVQEADMIRLTNDYREWLDLSTLAENNELMTSAQEKADTICKTGDWSHDAGAEKFYAPIVRAGYDYTHAGENLAKGYDTPGDAFKALMNSPTHLANITGDYKDIGVGFNECGGKNYYVIHYGEK